LVSVGTDGKFTDFKDLNLEWPGAADPIERLIGTFSMISDEGVPSANRRTAGSRNKRPRELTLKRRFFRGFRVRVLATEWLRRV